MLLRKTVKTHKLDKHALLVIGDFNAKTGSGHNQYPENMGKYGKGKINSSGEFLMELAKENNLILTNTLFPHKLAHRTTWTSPERIKDHNHHDGIPRKKPYRNQIDYILTKRLHKNLILNSRSYSGITTFTDHKLVKASLNLEWRKLKYHKTTSKQINTHNLENTDKITKYKETIMQKIIYNTENENPNETCIRISKTCLETAEKLLGYKEKNKKKIVDEELIKLSAQQKNIRNDIESSTMDYLNIYLSSPCLKR